MKDIKTMSTLEEVKTVLQMLPTLTKNYIEHIVSYIDEEGLAPTNDLTEFVEEERFAGGRFCPRCGGVDVIRFGKRPDGVQRYKCYDCERTFSATSNSIVSYTKKDMKVWRKYIECMMNGMSVRKSAEVCNIHPNTAFVWRHKILDALQKMQDEVELDGIVEADETFLPLSYKGNHSKSKTFVMPRKPHKHGHQTKKPGLSLDQVCIPCAVNRKRLSIARVGKLGKVSYDCIEGVFQNQIKSKSILCTDGEKSYRRFSNEHDFKLVQLESGKSKRGIYNIQHINNYHSQLKHFLYRFHGVATKYLNNYLVWHNLVNYYKQDQNEKAERFFTFVVTTQNCTRYASLSFRPEIPLPEYDLDNELYGV